MSWTTITPPPSPSDTSLQSWDSWTRTYSNPYLGGGGNIVVNKTTRRLEGQAQSSGYRYSGASAPSGDQIIRATWLTSPLAAEGGFGLLARETGSSYGYMAVWVPSANLIQLHRSLGGVGAGQLASTSTTVALNSVVTQGYLSVTGTGSTVTVVVGDATRGSVLTYADTGGDRGVTGTPGIVWDGLSAIYGSGASVAWLTNVQIEDWSTGAAVVVKQDAFNPGGWVSIARPS